MILCYGVMFKDVFACGFCAVEHLTFNQGVHAVNPYAPVAQLVEHLTFVYGGRNIASRLANVGQDGSGTVTINTHRVANSPHFAKQNLYAPVAQLVEHLTFNQGVRSSILRRSTKKSHTPKVVYGSFCALRLENFAHKCEARSAWSS